MADDDIDYTGTDNLEVMQEAANYNRFLIDMVCQFARPDYKIVDFGAGIGTFAEALTTRRLSITCVETDPLQRARVASKGLVCVSSLAELPVSKIDYLFSLNVLEHIPDDEAVLRAIHQVLKPGGYALIYVPAFMCLFSSMDRKVGHVRRYTRSDLVHKMTACGFQVQIDQYVDSLGFLASLLYRWVGSSTGDIDRDSLRFYDRAVFPVSRLFDKLFSTLFGKNLLVVARRPE